MALSIFLLTITQMFFEVSETGELLVLYSALSLSAAWLTVFIVILSFIVIVTFQVLSFREGSREAAILTELGAPQSVLFGLYFLKAILLGAFSGVLGFFMVYGFFAFIGWGWFPNLYLLALSTVLVTLATLVSNIYFLRTVPQLN